MNTSAINNPLGILQAPASNKQDMASPSDTGAFNQVLSREIAGRNNADSNTATHNTQKEASGKGDGTTNAKNDNSNTTAAETAKSAENEKAAALAVSKKDEADPAATDPSAELLAFVAALTQANTAQAPAADTAPDTLATTKAADIDTKLDADSTLAATTTAAGSEKDAIGKKSDFVSALDKATVAANENSKTPAAASAAAKGDADLAVAAATTTAAAKAIEPATVSNPQTIAINTAALQHLNETRNAQSAKLAPQVGSPGWDQALGQKVVWMIQGAQQTATLTLNPPDLGPMQVTLNVSNNQATANFTAHQPEVRQALEAAMPRLREMLNDAGIQLGQSSVSAGSPNQQQTSGEQQQGGRQASRNDNAVEPVIHVSHVPLPSSGSGMVDTFA
ncbi:putative flagellar hook-length control protein FliK [Herminiimonas arsenicoxydans]|uniref:FliK n=1 Tax=Herminiimonas arsenicoxydans TaxID=204773 RepID=Q5QCQ2_HERAR|nr:FliK [Herminiimonas arsenicoxydans]CAL62032.1 putative flagellar hook-length control protein FliK [Herminiimonas arsenicoxydans]